MCVQHTPALSSLIIPFSDRAYHQPTYIITDIRQDVSKLREDTGSQNRWYVTCVLFTDFRLTLTAAQTQNRSAISTTERSGSNICIQRAWGTTTPTARDLLRTRRAD
jgi:hypothetical protein